ncbi:MAG: ATP-binding protein [Bacteroidales bacterium]|nr:ATP-binding protein [Bacteroidales bacterium]
MMCGVAGSGKTTFAQKLEKIGFSRLSIDEEIWSTNGRYGIDYPVGQ